MISLLLILAAQAEPIAVSRIDWVAPFTLTEPYTYFWQQERPVIQDGLMMVLRADPELVRRRQIASPLLFVGAVPAERMATNDATGCTVAFVPGTPNLTTTPIFFGSAELAERVDHERGAEELAAAMRAGVTPVAPGPLDQAAMAGGGPIRATTIQDVYGQGARML